MIFGLNRDVLVGRVGRGTLRHRPGQENALVLDSEVVMHPGRPVLLDDEGAPAGSGHLRAGRLRGFIEVAFGPVFVERHRVRQYTPRGPRALRPAPTDRLPPLAAYCVRESGAS